MDSNDTVSALSFVGIAHRCRRESERFFQRLSFDPQYCYELFRRAIVERADYAWELLYQQYTPLVVGWVERHSGFASSGEDAAYFANRAFEKMWVALTPEKFQKFPDLKSLLRYLQMCVGSVVTDHVRAASIETTGFFTDTDEEQDDESGPGDQGVEPGLIQRQQQEDLWRLIDGRLNDEQERRLVYYRYMIGLKPREICERFPAEFPDVKEIFRITQNILARLRRDEDLRKFFDDEFGA